MVNQRKGTDIKHLVRICAILLLIGILSNYYFVRVDFTHDKRYTLSGKTTSLLNKLNDKVLVTVYLEGDLPSAFKRLQRSTADILTDYKAYAGNNLSFSFINPLQGADQAKQDDIIAKLYQQGIEPTSLNIKTESGFTQKLVFPVAVVSYKGQQMVVKLLQNMDAGGNYEQHLNSSIENLEYALSSSLNKLMNGGRPRVAFTEGHRELTDAQLADAMRSLGDGYEVGRIDLKSVTKAGLDKLKVLVIAKPELPFTEAEKYKIDHFVMHGGRVLWSIDNVSADLDSLKGAREQLVFAKKLELDDMLFVYGARVNYDLIADMSCAQIPVAVGQNVGDGQIAMAPWLFFPILVPNSASAVVKNIDGIKTEFPSTVDTIAVKGVHKQVILSTSPYSKVFTVPKTISLQMVEEEPNPKAFFSKPKTVGVMLSGSFPSVFENRPVPQGVEPMDVSDHSVPGKMVVIGDGDVFKNQVSGKDGSPFPLGYDRYTQQTFGNKTLLLNLVDHLTDDSGIVELRKKEISMRLLNRARIREEKTMWQVLNIGLPLLMLILFGIFQHYLRKRAYAR